MKPALSLSSVKPCIAAAALVISMVLVPAGFSQWMDGRLEVRVLDPSGRGVPASIELASRSPEFVATAEADLEGNAVLRRVPPGVYRLAVRHPGFEAFERQVEFRSAVPRSIKVILEVAPVTEEITVSASAPLFEPLQPSVPMRAGRQSLDRTLGTTLGRSTVDVVTTMPGWLIEANAVLHPRGSEYDTQYVIDGMPLYDNRSIAFAPPFENSEFEAVNVFTAGIPAEYGRRLGGVIALDTRRTNLEGHHFTADLQSGSYLSRGAALSHQYARKRTEVSYGVFGGLTDRYLDPPSIENFTNRGHSKGANLRFARDLGSRDRLTFYARRNQTSFLVPNDLVQQQAGQRQDRKSTESAGQVHYQGAFSARSLLSIRGMLRDLTSELWSNTLSTPVFVLQDRGLREGALTGDLTFEEELHTLKIGGDLRVSGIRERFLSAEPDELPEFDIDFRSRKRNTDASLFIQDHIRAGNFAASLGVRFDHYSLLIKDRAVSPRLAASYYLPAAALQFYASYDRIFQPPPMENLLLSSAAAGFGLDDVEGSLSVPASRAHFFEVGVRKPFADVMRLEIKHYWRKIRNAIDDDVFLNTGLSFPITFDSAEVEGTELRLETPRWRGISAVASYSNMLGLTSSPVTGGLFVEGGEAEELRDVIEEFPISQDQRNTIAAMVRFQLHPRVWASAGLRYGSGLPVELEDDDDDEEEDGDTDEEEQSQPISQEILEKVNFERGRVRPNLSIDLSIGAQVWAKDRREATLQFDIRNVTDRLNVINFSGLFSGTALAPGRQSTIQLRLRF